MTTTIQVFKRGYDYSHGEGYINVPYGARKADIVSYIKEVFGQDAFLKHNFEVVRRAGSRWGHYR